LVRVNVHFHHDYIMQHPCTPVNTYFRLFSFFFFGVGVKGFVIRLQKLTPIRGKPQSASAAR
jgi:hypothetical protein